ADRERGEIEIITAYLPKQMSEAQAQAAVAQVIEATGATSIKDMGKVMAALKQGYAGRLDFGKASGLVKAMSAGGGPRTWLPQRESVAGGRPYEPPGLSRRLLCGCGARGPGAGAGLSEPAGQGDRGGGRRRHRRHLHARPRRGTA